MSCTVRSNPVTNTRSTNSKKPYCKVCFDAGKPESEYTSHWVRSLPDRSGKTTVTCPTLLNTECNYCYNFGHTVKFCPSIKQLKIEQNNADRKAKVSLAHDNKKLKVQETSASVFAVLIDSDSEEDKRGKVSKVSKVSKPVENVVDNFPVLSRQVNNEKSNQAVKTSWAAIAAKPVEMNPEPTKQTGFVLLSDFIKLEPKPEPKPEPKLAPWATKKPVVTRSWADLSDSEDEPSDPYETHWSRWGDSEEEDDYGSW